MLTYDSVLFFDVRPFAILAKIDKDSRRADVRTLEHYDGLTLLKYSVRH
jgi:hypothetical protein